MTNLYPQKKSLHFALLCTGKTFRRWQADAINELIGRGHQPVLIITEGSKVNPPGLVQKIKNKAGINYSWATFPDCFVV